MTKVPLFILSIKGFNNTFLMSALRKLRNYFVYQKHIINLSQTKSNNSAFLFFIYSYLLLSSLYQMPIFS